MSIIFNQIYIYIYIYVCVCVCVCVYVWVSLWVWMYVCVYVHTHTYIHAIIYICIRENFPTIQIWHAMYIWKALKKKSKMNME